MTVNNHKKITHSEIISLGIGVAVFAVTSTILRKYAVHYYSFINGDFFYSLSFGILSWASIQSAALLAMYLNLQSEIKNLANKFNQNNKENYFEFMYRKHQHIFKMYARALFRGWIASFVLAIMGLIFIVTDPDITVYWIYFLGALMFSIFVCLLIFLFLSIVIYHSIFNKNS